ncbi:oligosaccharide flippase family protein [bacterium]|nr:oligosaccharide flippase family protein [bacterium]
MKAEISDDVIRGMITLALGSGVGRLIGIAAIPLLTRLYSPDDFGVLAVFSAFIAILAPILTMRYVLTLPLPRHDGLAMNLLAVSVSLMLVMSTLITLLLWLGGETFLNLVSMPVLAPWWWLIPLGAFGTAAYEVLALWATRKRAYKLISQTSIIQSAAGAVVKIGLGLVALQPLGLLIGQVLAQAGGIGRMFREFWPEFQESWRHVSANRMRKAAWQHKGFPIWRVPSQFLMVLSMQAPMLFIAALYDADTTGHFGLALMVLSLPMNIIGQSAGKALYGEASKTIKDNPKQVAQMARDLQFRLLLIALLPVLIIFKFSEDLFSIIFGTEWATAGSFASILAFAMLFQFTSAPLIQLMNLLSKQSAFLAINVLRLLGLVAIFYTAHFYNFSAISFVTLYAIYTALFYLAVSAFVLRAVTAISSR